MNESLSNYFDHNFNCILRSKQAECPRFGGQRSLRKDRFGGRLHSQAGSGWKSLLAAAPLCSKGYDISTRRLRWRGELSEFITVTVVYHFSVLFHPTQCGRDGLTIKVDAAPLRDLNGASRIKASRPRFPQKIGERLTEAAILFRPLLLFGRVRHRSDQGQRQFKTRHFVTKRLDFDEQAISLALNRFSLFHLSFPSGHVHPRFWFEGGPGDRTRTDTP